MGVANRTTLLSSLDSRLKNMFLSSKGNLPRIADVLFKEESSSRAYEIYNSFVGVSEAGIVGEGSILPQKDLQQNNSKTLQPDKYGFLMNVSYEEIQDNQFSPIAGEVGKAMRMSMDQTRERAASNVFNNGFDSTVQTSPDGVALFSTAHVLVNGGTQSNSDTASSLDIDSFWRGINTMQTSKDDSTLYMSIYSPKYIFVPQQLERRAYEILKSDKVPFIFENTLNVAKQLYGMEVRKTPLLTSTTAWFFLADPNEAVYYGPRYVNREALSIKTMFDIVGDQEVGANQECDVYTWKTRERYVFGVTHWIGTYGNAGA